MTLFLHGGEEQPSYLPHGTTLPPVPTRVMCCMRQWLTYERPISCEKEKSQVDMDQRWEQAKTEWSTLNLQKGCFAGNWHEALRCSITCIIGVHHHGNSSLTSSKLLPVEISDANSATKVSIARRLNQGSMLALEFPVEPVSPPSDDACAATDLLLVLRGIDLSDLLSQTTCPARLLLITGREIRPSTLDWAERTNMPFADAFKQGDAETIAAWQGIRTMRIMNDSKNGGIPHIIRARIGKLTMVCSCRPSHASAQS